MVSALLLVVAYWLHPDNQKRREARARIKQKRLFRQALERGDPDAIARMLFE